MYGHTLACMDLSWENLSNKYEQIWDTYTFVHTFIKKHQRNNFIPVQRVFWCLLCKYYVLQIYFAQPTRAMQMYSFQAFKDSDNLRSLSIRSHIFGPINKHGFSSSLTKFIFSAAVMSHSGEFYIGQTTYWGAGVKTRESWANLLFQCPLTPAKTTPKLWKSSLKLFQCLMLQAPYFLNDNYWSIESIDF